MSPEAWALTGIAATIVVGLPAYFLTKSVRRNRQSQKVGRNGRGYQAGRDIHMGKDE